MRDSIEVREDRMMCESDADKFRIAVTLVSFGPDDVDWLNENAQGWRDHLSCRTVEATGVVAGIELVMAHDPMELIRTMRSHLAYELATHLINQMEPIVSRYTHDGRWERM